MKRTFLDRILHNGIDIPIVFTMYQILSLDCVVFCMEWRNFATFEIFGVFNIVFSTFWFETRNFACFWVLCVLSLCPTGYCYTAATCTTNVLFIFVCDPDSHDFTYYILLRLS